MKDINEILLHAKFIKQKGYWGKKLSPGMTETEFLLDYTSERERKTPEQARRTEINFSPALSRQVIAFSKHSDLSLYIVLLSVLKLLIYRYGNSLEITVISPVYMENVSGDTLNDILYIQDRLGPDKPFLNLLMQVRESVLGAYENQDYPSDKLIEYLFSSDPLERTSSISNVLCWLKNIHDQRIVEGTFKKEKDKLIFSFIREEDRVSGYLLYSPAVYEEGFIRQVSRHFVRMLENSLRDIKAKISGISLSLDEESQRLIEALNRTCTEYPREKTLHQLFEEQEKRTPDNTAVIGPGLVVGTQFIASDPGEKNVHLTYNQLNHKSNQWARWLRAKGVKPDRIVGLMAEGSLETLPGIFAILKAGGAFLPIDSRCPWARKQLILEDSDTTIVITQQAVLEMNKEIHRSISGENILLLDHEIRDRTSGPGEGAAANPEAVNHPGDLAYVIYTSGTTGKPKGVMIEHRSAVNYTWWAAITYVKNEKLDFPLYTSISFDLTVTSIFTPLVTGNRVVVYEYEEGDKELLIQKVINENTVGVIKLTPSHLRLIQDKKEKWIHSCIKRLIVGGEDFPAALAKEVNGHFSPVEIYNEYGPTEATVGCMIYKFNPETDGRRSVPIGVPADNVQIYLLDKNSILPPGVTGELHISGDGLARGYLNRPGLTAEKFCLRWPVALFEKTAPGPRKNFLLKETDKNYLPMQYHSLPPHYPITPLPHHPIYLTGDLARWLPDGNIEFLGRIDNQVKIRGFRIELGEIESRLMSHDAIKEAVVLERKSGTGEKYLCGYIVPVEGPAAEQARDISVLREFLSHTLPDYMIPAHFVQVEKIPLTANGKLDRKALISEDSCSALNLGTQYVEPGNELEKLIADTWKEILHLEKVGVNDNFFALGGNSLKVIRLNSRINQKLAANIPVAVMFERLTIRSFVKYLSPGEAGKEKENHEMDRSDVLERTKPKRAERKSQRKIKRHQIEQSEPGEEWYG